MRAGREKVNGQQAAGQHAAGQQAAGRIRFLNRTVILDAFVTGVLFWAGAAFVVAPVTIRNCVKGGELVLTTAHGGINFYIGNNPDADGWYKTPAGFKGSQEGLIRSGKRIAERETGCRLSHSEVSSFWFARGKDFIFDSPGSAALLFLKKLYLFWNFYEKPLEGNIYYTELFSKILRTMTLGFGIVAPFALLGLLLQLGRWRDRAGLPALFVIVYMGTLVLFFVTSRYRITVLPFMLLFGAGAVWWCIDRLFGRDWKRLAAASLLLAAAAVLSNTPLFGLEGCGECDLAFSYYGAGTTHLKNERYEAALEDFDEALRLNPNVPYFYGNKGITLNNLGRHDEAAEMFETFALRWPRSPEAHSNLAATYVSLGRIKEAEREYVTSLRLKPNQPGIREALARIYEKAGRPRDAERVRKRKISNHRQPPGGSGGAWP